MKRDWAAQRQSLPTVRFNAANGEAWFWPKIAAALKNIIGWSLRHSAPRCPLLEVKRTLFWEKRTSLPHRKMSANDPKRTLARLATARPRQ
jgi:hypothetical protein